jgi:hypothetical protein
MSHERNAMSSRTCFIGLLAITTVLGPVAVAQDRPDFSGAWKPVDSASTPLPPPTPGGPPPPPRTVSITIAQSAAELKVDRRAEMGGRETVHNFIYRLDGTESVNQMGPLTFRTKAAWQGAALVLTSVIAAGDRTIGDSKEVYRLENGALIVEGTRKTPAGTLTWKTVHAKTPAER